MITTTIETTRGRANETLCGRHVALVAVEIDGTVWQYDDIGEIYTLHHSLTDAERNVARAKAEALSASRCWICGSASCDCNAP